MSAVILNGREAAARIKRKLAHHILSLQKSHNVIPGLAMIRVGEQQASQVYVASKVRQCHEVGLRSFQAVFDTHAPQEKILEQIHRFNANSQIHGILVQLPLPASLDTSNIIKAIDPLKDVDGLHPENLGALMAGTPSVIPCTPRGCLKLIKQYKKNLKGLQTVIIGRSLLVGKPLALLLLAEDCTVTLAHSKTYDLPMICRQADILVAAVGSPKLVKKEWVKPGAIVLDVGINHVVSQEGIPHLWGDVDFEEVQEVAGALTPVPGGVGPMTVAMLLQNTVELTVRQI